MTSKRRYGGWAALVILCAPAAACEFGRDRPTTPVLGAVSVTSDPSGAEIFVNGRSTGAFTPGVVEAPAGQDSIQLQLVDASETFVWRGSVLVPETAQVAIHAALAGGCFNDCPFRLSANDVACAITSDADLCSIWGSPLSPAGRNAWPISSGNEYVFSLRPMAGAVVGPDGGAFAGDSVSSFLYQLTWQALSRISLRTEGGASIAEHRHWSDPSRSFSTRIWLLGIQVDQRVIQPNAADFPELRDIVYFRFHVTNVTGDSLYRHWHPEIPEGGWTYTDVYVGMAMDGDIGGSGDDVGTYVPDSGVAFLYDLDFEDGQLVDGYDTKPPLVALVRVETPPQAARFPFSLWPSGAADWDGDTRFLDDDDLGLGYRILSARLQAGDPILDCPGDDIGHCSDAPDDYRLSLMAGPLTLPPGDTTTFVMALVYADPVTGQFTSGVNFPPGDPTASRPALEAVADSLLARARRAVTLWPTVGGAP